MKKEILLAYNKLVAEIKTLQKNTENPYFKSKYVDLNDILDEVKDKIVNNGFSLIQYPVYNKLRTQLIWVETGETFIECELDLIGTTDMQKLGSAITYSRRYSLLPILQMQCEDDDGNQASGNSVKLEDIVKLDDFKDFIKNAKSASQLGACYYRWSKIFLKGTEEYDELNRLSAERKQQIM